MSHLEPSIHQQLCESIGEANVLTDSGSCILYAQDIFNRHISAAAVVRPANTEQLSNTVRLLTEHGHAVIARGGGMSYTKAYVPEEAGSVMIDSGRMNEVLEVNSEDMFVRVQAGCSWKKLHEALKPYGMRTPFWGPLSGIHATVGGSVSQNSVYWGAGSFGSSADSVIAMEVVLADGTVLNTGSAAQQYSTSFFRHFGPDLTGLFCCDCGSLGVKASISLRLMPEFTAFKHISYDFPEIEPQVSALSDIARQDLAAQMFGTDPTLNKVRAERDRLANDLKAFGKVLKNAGSISEAVGTGARMAVSGRSAVRESSYALHATVEDRTDSAAREKADAIEKICQSHGGKKIDNSVPTLLRASPFNPLNNILGPQGERWVPIHALLPHSRVLTCVKEVKALFERHSSTMTEMKVQSGFLLTTVSTNCFFIEPLFFWPDEINELHKETVESAVLKRQTGFSRNLPARELVAQLREELASMFSTMGASHLQLGKEYHYRSALKPAAGQLIDDLKKLLDPNRRINPGALGL